MSPSLGAIINLFSFTRIVSLLIVVATLGDLRLHVTTRKTGHYNTNNVFSVIELYHFSSENRFSFGDERNGIEIDIR